MTLMALAVLDTGAVQLTNAKGAKLLGDDGKPAVITLYSPGSAVFEAASDARMERAVERRRIKGDEPLTGSEIRADSVTFLADVTHSASQNFAYDEAGSKLVTRDDFLQLYRHKPLGFIYEKLTRELNDWGNFTAGSVTS